MLDATLLSWEMDLLRFGDICKPVDSRGSSAYCVIMASCDGRSLEIKVETRRAVAQPQSYRIASAVSQPLVDPATAASATKVGGGTSSGAFPLTPASSRTHFLSWTDSQSIVRLQGSPHQIDQADKVLL